MDTLPILDISALMNPSISAKAKTQLTDAVEASCCETGFMVVRGHGIACNTIAQARNAVSQLFDLPMEIKNKYCVSNENYRGYIPLGFFDANHGGFSADQYEGYKLHYEVAVDDTIRQQCDLYGPNKWPLETPALQSAIQKYWHACDQLTFNLLSVFEDILNFDSGFFHSVFDQPLTNMTLLRYPPSEANDHYGIHPHKDTDVLTIVAPDPSGGLYLRPRDSHDWVAADAPPDCLILNIGDMLELWSGGYFVSTPHKVVNKSTKARISFPYFAVPRYDTVVETKRPPQSGFQREPLHVGDISREVWRTNWANTTPTDANLDLGTLDD